MDDCEHHRKLDECSAASVQEVRGCHSNQQVVLGQINRQHTDRITGPNEVMFADKSSVQKILVEDDFIKAPIYESIRLHPKVTSLITERDKVAYKQKVSCRLYLSSNRMIMAHPV